jgi:hypothetical protein
LRNRRCLTQPQDTQRYVQAALDRHGGMDVFLASDESRFCAGGV